MTDYTNPEVMKEIKKEATTAGIFAIGKDKKLIKETYLLRLDIENLRRLERIITENITKGISLKNQQRIKYNLVQIDSECGGSSLIKPKKIKFKILNDVGFCRKGKVLMTLWSIKDKSTRAWDNVRGNIERLYFKSSLGFIDIIEVKEWKK